MVIGSGEKRADMNRMSVIFTDAPCRATMLLREMLLEENAFGDTTKGAVRCKASVACRNSPEVGAVALALGMKQGFFVMRT